MRILFQGDSVTDCGRNRECYFDLGQGYVKYTAEMLLELLPETELEFVNRGVSGDRTKDVLARADRDIVEVDPDIITILIGVNDTWRRYDCNDPTSAEQFAENYEAILKIIKEKTHAKIVLIDAFLVYGMGRDHYREDLNAKLDETRKLAVKYADAYVPLDGYLASALVGEGALEPVLISEDGVHPAEEGKKLIAKILAPALADLAKTL